MASAPLKADEIQLAMQRVRCNLGIDVSHLVQQGRDMTDWRHYVRQYPWLCLGATAAAGYLLVPRARRIIQEVAPTGDTEKSSAGKALKGSAGGLVSAIAVMAIRSAASAVVQHGLAFLKQRKKTPDPAGHPPAGQPARGPDSVDEEEPW